MAIIVDACWPGLAIAHQRKRVQFMICGCKIAMLTPPRSERSNKLSLFCLTWLLVAMFFAGQAMAVTCDDSKGEPLRPNDMTSGMTTDLEVTGPCEVKGSASILCVANC